MFEITGVRHMYPEPAGFFIDRKKGHRHYTFLHFHNSVRLRIGEGEIVTQPHAVILFAPGEPQYFQSEEALLHDWFHFEGDLRTIPLQSLRLGEVFYPSEHGRITRLVAELEMEFFAGKESSALLSDCKVKELFIALDRDLNGKDAGAVGSRTREKFRYLRGEMLSSLSEHHSVDALAAKVGLSPSRFFTLYRKIYGTSPIEDLIVAKIRSAKNKLAYSRETVEGIAASLAYENTTHFIRQFKARTGVTPSAYRRSVIPSKNGKTVDNSRIK